MTRIGVISDTHLRQASPELAQRVKQAWGPVDMILHAGDITNLAVLDSLAPPEVIAVAGNMDSTPVKASLPDSRVVEVGGLRIGLAHGWGSPLGLGRRVAAAFQGVQAVVYGHSHRAANKVVDGVLLFNPGSAGGSRMAAPSVGLLVVDQGIEGHILKL